MHDVDIGLEHFCKIHIKMEPDSSQEFQESNASGMFQRKRRKRTIIAAEQLMKLEELYKHEQWPGREKKEDLAHEIGMSTHFVNIWFQNKRSRMKKIIQEEEELKAIKSKLSQSDCEEEIADSKASCTSQKSHSFAFAADRKSKSMPEVSAPVRPIRPMPTGGMPVVAVGKVGTLVQSTSKNTLITTVPIPTYHLRSGAEKHLKGVTSKFVSIPASKITDAQSHGTSVPSGGVSMGTRARLRERANQTRMQTSGNSSDAFRDPAHVGSRGSLSQEINQDQGPANKKTSKRQAEHYPCCATSLLRCLILMMALAESPGAVPPGTDEFDLAVCACLYGVKIGDGRSFLTYDEEFGFQVEKVGKKSKKDKRKKKKKKHRSERRT